MTVEDVIELIKKRRKQHLRSPVGEDAGDPLRWSEGGFPPCNDSGVRHSPGRNPTCRDERGKQVIAPHLSILHQTYSVR